MADETQSILLSSTEEKMPALPGIYFNGFEVGISLSDIYVTLGTNGHHHSRLLMSFTTAKTLMAHLKQTVEAFEKRTKHTIMTMGDVNKALELHGDGTEK